MKSPYWLLAGVLLAGSVQAIPQFGPVMGPGMGPGPYGHVPMAAPQMPAPAVALRSGMDKLLAYLGSDQRPSADELAEFLNAEIAPFFDFEYMTKTAGGRLFENLNDADQQAMVEQIKQSFLSTMAEKLGSYEQQQVRFLPPRGGQGDRTAQVSVAIMNPGSYPARLDFRLYRNGENWLVYDVSANGQSAIVHYRNQLMREVQERRMQRMRAMYPSGPRMGPGMPPPGYAPGFGPRY